MLGNSTTIRFPKYALLTAGSYAIWYFSSSNFISLTLLWLILGLILLLYISFLIWDYGIKREKISKFNQALLILSIIITVIFSIGIFL